MKQKQGFPLKTLLFSFAFILVLAGCSGEKTSTNSTPSAAANNSANSSTNTEPPASQDEASGYPIVIKHAFGETVIEKSLSASPPFNGRTMMSPLPLELYP